MKASSSRVASRIANTLKAGHPVSSLASFADCPLVLICVAEEDAVSAIHGLALSGLPWTGRSVVLCDSTAESGLLSPLKAQGAFTATYSEVGGRAVMEGDRKAIAAFRRALLPRSQRVLCLSPGGKPAFLAGLTLAGLPVFLAAGAAECFRESGCSGPDSRQLTLELLGESIHSFGKSGWKALGSQLDEDRQRLAAKEHEALFRTNPDLAAFYASMLRSSVALVPGQPAPDFRERPTVVPVRRKLAG